MAVILRGLYTKYMTTREAGWYIILAVSVCLCLSVCQTITFESLDVGSSYLHTRYISTDCGLSSYEGHWVKIKVR